MTKMIAGQTKAPLGFSPAAMIMLRALCDRGAFDQAHAIPCDDPQLAAPLIAAGLMDHHRVRPYGGITRTLYWVTELGQRAWIAAVRAHSQVCRHCGCTDSNACMGANGEPCHWTAPGLCSAPDCQRKEREAAQ